MAPQGLPALEEKERVTTLLEPINVYGPNLQSQPTETCADGAWMETRGQGYLFVPWHLHRIA